MQPSDIFAILPKYNCFACGFIFCSTFARRVAFSKNKPEECIFLSQENLGKIRELLKQEIETEKIKNETAFIHPCTEEGHVTAETNICSYANFGNGFNEELLCLILENSDFEECNCSSELGYAIIYKDTKRIHIFKNGNITIRKAKDNEDIFSTLNFISVILLPATITDCQCSFIECYLKNCDCCKKEFEKNEMKLNEKLLNKSNGRIAIENSNNSLRQSLRNDMLLLNEFENIIELLKNFDKNRKENSANAIQREEIKIDLKDANKILRNANANEEENFEKVNEVLSKNININAKENSELQKGKVENGLKDANEKKNLERGEIKKNFEIANEILRNIFKKSIKLISEKKNSGMLSFALGLCFRNVLSIVQNSYNFSNYENEIKFFIECFDSLKNSDKNKAKNLENKHKELSIKIKDDWRKLKIVNSGYLILKLAIQE